MKKLLTSIAIISCLSSYSQDFDKRWNAAYELITAEQYDEAIAAYEPLLVEQPDYAETHVQMAWCYLIKGNMDEAGARAQTAFQIDQLSPSVFAINSYLLYAAGMADAGIIFLNDAVWFMPNDEDLQYFQDDFQKMKGAGLDIDQLERDFADLTSDLAGRDKSWGSIQTKFYEGLEILNNGDNAGAKAAFKDIFPVFENVPAQQQRFIYHLSYVIGSLYYNVDDSTNYMPLLTRTYEHIKENMTRNHRIILHMNTLLGSHYYAAGNYDKSFEILSEGLDYFSPVNSYRFLGSMKAQFLMQYAASALAVGNITEARDAGRLITELDYTGYDEWYATNGLIYMAQSWEENGAKAQEYYRQAYDLANASGFEDLQSEISAYLKNKQ